MVAPQQFPLRELSTKQLADLYLERPRAIVTMDLGAWFTLGTGLHDPDLARRGNQQHAIDHIQNAGYDCIPHLAAKLRAFNEFNKD